MKPTVYGQNSWKAVARRANVVGSKIVNGLSWQIVPKALPRMLGATDMEAAGRAQEAMMTMKKIDIAKLEAAFHGN